MNQIYLDTARLMMQIAPFVFADGIFALKGGTAINLFLRDMLRLSVDLDLVFVNHRPSRDDALASINAAIRTAVGRLEASGFRTYVAVTADVGETKLFFRRRNIDVNVHATLTGGGKPIPARLGKARGAGGLPFSRIMR